MKASYVSAAALGTLLDPDAPIWSSHSPERVSMLGTPAGMQPSAAIQVAWKGRKIGAIERAEIKALHNGEELAFRLEWADASEDAELPDNDSFPDAAAILLPAAKGAPLMTMGAPELPVNAWYWRADERESARHLVATGLGTSHTFDRTGVRGQGHWKSGRWRVVMARALRMESDQPLAQLPPGAETGFGIAIWEGSSAERGGLKSFSGNWLPLQLEPTTSGRNG
ncbi:MAG: hypothetical protein JRH16_01045 [Deltaproteobacteria bacterium]|nr:hypothetical protein [Deltaproteobacteria bacterium]MBW2360726.1 hypothetical protein [Deltaproteobacteria bacterium]